MSARIQAGAPRRGAAWRALSDEEWVKLHVPRFEKIRHRYEDYEQFLKAVLAEACRTRAPLAIVATRTKSLSSFAEKILRKRGLYLDTRDPLPPDPLVRMTDLMGGRVIMQNSEQVQAICRFIVEAFDIDWDNSEDVSKRLRPTEFGYRSVHYIVKVNRAKLRDAGIRIPVSRTVLGLKAELQVRTLLEHAWADIGHDMTYKTELKVPAQIHRQFAAVAAVLESTDHEFGRLVHDFDTLKSNFGAYHTHEEVEKEINSLRVLLSTEAGTDDIAMRIGQLALSIGKHKLALKILKPYARSNHQGVQRMRGLVLTEMYGDEPRSRGYRAGRRSLEAACAHPRKDAETLGALAECWVREDTLRARQLFHEAIVIDPSGPAALSRYLEFEVACSSSDQVLQLAAPMISDAMKRARSQIDARVNLPWAWASLAMLHLFRQEPFEALNAIAQVIRLCDPPQYSPRARKGAQRAEPPCAAGRALMRLRDSLKHIACIKDTLPGYSWCERAVLLGLAIRAKDSRARKALRKLASPPAISPRPASDATVVILSGGCAEELRENIKMLKPHLVRATKDLSFTLLWGGTDSGMSGLAGLIARTSNGRIKAFGYLPRHVGRRDQKRNSSMRFIRCSQSPGRGFTPLEPLQGWTDLLAAGFDTNRVKMLCYAAGPICRAEYAMALALGARVGVIDDATLPMERRLDDPGWEDHGNLIHMPMDAMTLRTFIIIDELRFDKAALEKAAEKAHEEYLASVIPQEPSLRPWKNLPEDLKISNYHQVAYAENMLRTVGLGIRPITDPGRPLLKMEKTIGKDGVWRLAEMEHGRWNIERLLLGWRYSPQKNVLRRLSPHLVSWRDMHKEIKEYDLKAICRLPEVFRKAGLEVYKL